MTVLVDRKTQANPVLVLKVTSGTDVQPAIKPGDTGVAVSDGFVTGWPVLAGAQEHRFKANGKRCSFKRACWTRNMSRVCSAWQGM